MKKIDVRIHFGLSFEEGVLPTLSPQEIGTHVMGPVSLLNYLEQSIGQGGYIRNTHHLAIEQFRQVLNVHLSAHPHAFYSASFEADPLATAETLLDMRDALLNSGYSFLPNGQTPERVLTLAQIEQLIQSGRNRQAEDLPVMVNTRSDRIHQLIQVLPGHTLSLSKLDYYDPWDLLPPQWQRLLTALQDCGVSLTGHQATASSQDSDLSHFQRGAFSGESTLKADGSLLLLTAPTEADAAAFMSTLLRLNPDFAPACIIPEKQRTLDRALQRQGLPSMGIPSASLARPSLQLLKLIPIFFWNPLDPYKLLEFVSLPNKPLHDELAQRIASLIAKRPGTDSASWHATIADFFEELAAKIGADSDEYRSAQQQFELWFSRRRYGADQRVTVEEVLRCFQYVRRWASNAYEDDNIKHASFLTLSEQADRICDLLENLPSTDQSLSRLELERIVRTIYAPSPIHIHNAAVGHLPRIFHEDAFIGKVSHLCWWNFVRKEPHYFFSRWYADEIAYLECQGCHVYGPVQQSNHHIWKIRQPLVHTTRQLVLIMPNHIRGQEQFPHSLHDELEAQFSNLEDIRFDAGSYTGASIWKSLFKLPQSCDFDPMPIRSQRPYLQLTKLPEFPQQDRPEYVSELERLCFYPHQWVLRRHAQLHSLPILSVVRENTLLGNLSHRIFELLLSEVDKMPKRRFIDEWFENHVPKLLRHEGTPLLLYGQEPLRRAFILNVKESVFTLLHHIFENGWSIFQTEHLLEGTFDGIPIRGRIDLLLQRGKELAIVDFKWRGSSHFKRVFTNNDDLQLALYRSLINEPYDRIHTSYFIIQSQEMIARSRSAFAGATATADIDAQAVETLYDGLSKRIAATLQWRKQQLESGFVELRSSRTHEALEAHYQGLSLDLLEMKIEDAPFDDYAILLNPYLLKGGLVIE